MEQEINPESREAAFDMEVQRLIRQICQEMKDDPQATPEKYRERVAELLASLQQLSDERGGVDWDVWLSFQIALAYDHFAGPVKEFDDYYSDSLKYVEYIIGYLQDSNLLDKWTKRIRESFY